MKFKQFLSKISSSYKNIDRFRAFKIYEKHKKNLSLKPVIHIVGTNGKGSTGRFLVQLLEGLNYKIGHFTSPHLFKFNERFYLNGDDISDALLEEAHIKLSGILGDDLDKISYFEYCTFLCPLLFEKCDFIVLEAGLGGEFDSTNIFEKRLSIFTKIGLDHTAILGECIEQIARTKLKAMSKLAIISNKQPKIVLDLAAKIAKIKNTNLILASNLSQNKALKNELEAYIKRHNLSSFLIHNLNLALNALIILTNENQAKKALSNLKALSLKARLEQIAPNLFVDVGHNEMAAEQIALKFREKKINLIYNSFLDKNILQILKKLKPIIAKIQLYKIKNEDRVLANDEIFALAKQLDIKCELFTKLEEDKISLVFGSFVLAQSFLEEFYEK